MRTRLASAPVVLGAAVVLLAAPAYAVAGNGSHNGSTNQTNAFQSAGCFKTTGNYSGSGSTSTAINDGAGHTYSGNVTVTWKYAFFQDSAGSTTDATCTTHGAGASGTANTATMKSNPVGSLDCSWTNGTYLRTGVGTTDLTIDFPSASGGCRVGAGVKTAMHFNNAGGFNQVGGTTDCSGGGVTSPPTACNETFTSFTMT